MTLMGKSKYQPRQPHQDMHVLCEPLIQPLPHEPSPDVENKYKKDSKKQSLNCKQVEMLMEAQHFKTNDECENVFIRILSICCIIFVILFALAIFLVMCNILIIILHMCLMSLKELIVLVESGLATT